MVARVSGKIIATNVVCEFETRDPVVPPNLRGVKTHGVGESITETEGAEKSHFRIYCTTFDRTAVVIHTRVGVT